MWAVPEPPKPYRPNRVPSEENHLFVPMGYHNVRDDAEVGSNVKEGE
jgi:hypothetical protein